METTIPFQGFYSSIHDSQLDYALESMFSDDQGHINRDLFDKAFNVIDWQEIHVRYAERYTRLFSDLTGINLKFKLLSSPKYYNFETDRIIAEIKITEVRKLFKLVNKDVLKKHIKDRFTSYDGFMSFYPNHLSEWPKDLRQWDLNHVGTLIEAYVLDSQDVPNEWEFSLLEDLSEFSYHLIGQDTNLHRLLNIQDYLITRENRI